MESFEKLKSLPDAEKLKIFEELLECAELAKDGSGDPEKGSPEKNLSSVFNNLTSGNNISSEGSPRKKQKTLDSWLIKSKDLSPHKDKSKESSRTLDSWLSKSKELSSQRDKAGTSSCTVEGSINQRLNPDVSESLDSAQPSQSNLDECNSLSASETIKEPLQNKKHPLSKFNNVNKSPVKNVQFSATKTSKTIVTDTKSYSLRSTRKRKFIDSSPDKSSTQADADNTSLGNFIVQSEVPNNIDIIQNNSPPDIYPDLSCKNDLSENGDSLNKNTRNRRSKKSNSISQSSAQSSRTIKHNKVTKLEDINIGEKTPEKNKLQKTTHPSSSSSLSDWEAFHILELACARINLNVLDILENERIQNVLNDSERLDNGAVFLINSFKSDEKILPVVHLIESRKKMDEILKKLPKPD